MEAIDVKKVPNYHTLCDEHPIRSHRRRFNSNYWLRELCPIDYKDLSKRWQFYSSKEVRRSVCSKCFRRNSQDIHLEIEDTTHAIIDLVFRGKCGSDVPQRKIWVNVYEVCDKETTKRRYARKVCQQVIQF